MYADWPINLKKYAISSTIPRVQLDGSLAQLVEQRPEEPRVPSSSLGGATKEIASSFDGAFSLAYFRVTLGVILLVFQTVLNYS